MSNKKPHPESSSDSDDILDSEDDFDEIPPINKDHFAYCRNPETKQEKDAPEGGFLTSLLESSHDSIYPVFKGQNIFSDDWDDAVVGWKEIVPNAKYVPRRKQRKKVESETEKPRGTVVRNSTVKTNEESQNNLNWNSNVEPVTYRYIPNNGQYRLHKFCKEERDWYTVRRKNAERVTPSLKARYVQREIKRQMKKDFNRKSSQEEKVGKSDVKRSQSTNSEGHRDKTPSFATLVKSASDLYEENISNRLDELDKEIKRDSWIRKSNDDQNKPFPFNVTKGKLHQKIKDSTAPPRRGPHDIQSGHSAFIVTPVGQQETLRPLEKITPQQRMKEDLVKVQSDRKPTEESGDRDTPSSGTELVKSAIEVTNFDLERLRILPLAESSKTYISEMVKSKQNGSRVVSTTVNKRMGTQFLSSITVDDTDFGGIDRDDNGEPVSAVRTSRSRTMKEPNLPEIAGRRLEVALTNYRLL